MRNFTDGQILTADDINTYLLNRDTESRGEGQKYLDELNNYASKLTAAKNSKSSYASPYAGLKRFTFSQSTRAKMKAETGEDANYSYEFAPYRCETYLKSINFGIVGNWNEGSIRLGSNGISITYRADQSKWEKFYTAKTSGLIGRVEGKVILWLFQEDTRDLEPRGRDGDPEIPFYCTGEKA